MEDGKSITDFKNAFFKTAAKFDTLTEEDKEDVFGDTLVETMTKHKGKNGATKFTYFCYLSYKNLNRAAIQKKRYYDTIFDILRQRESLGLTQHYDNDFQQRVENKELINHFDSYGDVGKMAYRHYALGESLREIGHGYGITHEAVRKKIKKVTDKIKKDLL